MKSSKATDPIDQCGETMHQTMKKYSWTICPKCDGEGTTDNPAFNGFTSCEWNEMDIDEQSDYMAGFYDVVCDRCDGRGSVKVANVAAMTFAEKRQLVDQRRQARVMAEAQKEIEAERAMGC